MTGRPASLGGAVASGGFLDGFERAAERVRYCLSFDCTDTPRELFPQELLGPDLPCSSERPDTWSIGHWYTPEVPEDDAAAEEWLAQCACMAISEAIHEALEWFRVDGQPWLDPHGPAEHAINQQTRHLTSQLAALAGRHRPDLRTADRGFDLAACRVEYRLTYIWTPPRKFHPDRLDGPRIPDAYGQPGATAPGDWEVEDYPARSAPVDEWLTHCAGMVLNEVIHEALEWFRVDGRPWLDPHGPAAVAILDHTDELLADLAATRRPDEDAARSANTRR